MQIKNFPLSRSTHR